MILGRATECYSPELGHCLPIVSVESEKHEIEIQFPNYLSVLRIQGQINVLDDEYLDGGFGR